MRPQLGAAWINYTPESCDRDTVDLLIDEALRLARSGGEPTPTGQDSPPGRQGADPGAARDLMDLTLLLDVIRAFKRHEVTRGEPASVKILREAIDFHWEGPRLPRGRKRSPLLQHSPTAREQRRQGDMSGLVYEHVLPISHVIRGLLADVPDDEEALRQVLRAAPQAVIITKAEDAAIDAAGMRDIVPSDGDPWSRYRAAGLHPERFAPFVEQSVEADVAMPPD